VVLVDVVDDVVVLGGVGVDSATSVVIAEGTDAAASDGVAPPAARLVQPVVTRTSPVIQILDRRAMT
jgi:hypothetical protein